MFDAYKVAVQLSLVNNVSTGLSAISVQLEKLNGGFKKGSAALKEYEKNLANIKKNALIGGAMLGVGAGMLHMLKGPLEDAKKLAQAQANFQTLNLSAADNAEAFSKAASMSQKLLGTNITDNVKAIHDLHTAFGDLHHAMRSADNFAKFGFVAQVMNDGKPAEGLIYSAAKALEHRGGKVMNDDAAFNGELDMMQRVFLGSRGKVNPKEFFQASQTGKMSYSLLDASELYGPFAAYMQAKSGSTAGTAQMTFMSSLIGGHMTNSAKGFMADLGLWDEGYSKSRAKMLTQISAGMSPEERKAMGILAPTHGGLKDEFVGMAVHTPSKFIQEVLAPAIRKRFGMDMTDEQVGTQLMKVFNRNTGDFTGEYVINAMKFKKDASIFQNSMGIGQAYEFYKKSPVGAELMAANAWKNLLTLIGTVYLPVVIKGLGWFAEKISALTGIMREHPTLLKALVSGFIGLGIALAVAGGIKLLGVAFSGISLLIGVAGGSTGLIGAVAGLLGPVGLAVIALGALGAAAYAFANRPLTQAEVDAQKHGGGVRLTPDAMRRSTEMGWSMPAVGAPSKSGAGGGGGDVYLDREKVGRVLDARAAKQYARQPTGARAVDPTAALFPVSASLGY